MLRRFSASLLPGRRKRPSPLLVSAVLLALSATVRADSVPRFPGEPWGVGTAAEPCVVCHSLEPGGPFRSAPNLYGIVGAEKARDREWYGYSLALLKSGGTWTEADLDAYLADAPAFAPGTRKAIRIDDAEQRARIIDFLRTLGN